MAGSYLLSQIIFERFARQKVSYFVTLRLKCATGRPHFADRSSRSAGPFGPKFQQEVARDALCAFARARGPCGVRKEVAGRTGTAVNVK